MRIVVALMVACGVLLAGCGGDGKVAVPATAKSIAITADDLKRHGAPLVMAHDAMITFQDKVEAGLSNAAVLNEWPSVAAEVKKNLRAYGELTWPAGWSDDDRSEMSRYQGSIEGAEKQWGVATDTIRTLMQMTRDADKAKVVTEYTFVQTYMGAVALARETALQPGKTPLPASSR